MFEHKPAKEEVEIYEEALNYYLQAHKVSLKITLLDTPLIIYSSTNNGPQIAEYYWIDEIIFNAPGIKMKIDHGLFSEYAVTKSKYFDEKFAWSDALEIQSFVYNKLGKFKTGFKVGNGDPYWYLWKLIVAKNEEKN